MGAVLFVLEARKKHNHDYDNHDDGNDHHYRKTKRGRGSRQCRRFGR